jgi:hypothetical protein
LLHQFVEVHYVCRRLLVELRIEPRDHVRLQFKASGASAFVQSAMFEGID